MAPHMRHCKSGHGKSSKPLAERPRIHSIRVSVSVGWDFPLYEAIVRQALKSKADLIVCQRYTGNTWRPPYCS